MFLFNFRRRRLLRHPAKAQRFDHAYLHKNQHRNFRCGVDFLFRSTAQRTCACSARLFLCDSSLIGCSASSPCPCASATHASTGVSLPVNPSSAAPVPFGRLDCSASSAEVDVCSLRGLTSAASCDKVPPTATLAAVSDVLLRVLLPKTDEGAVFSRRLRRYRPAVLRVRRS